MFLVSSFICGISPGTIVFDVRTNITGVPSLFLADPDQVLTQSYDVLEDLVAQAQVHYKKLNKVLTDDLYKFNDMVSDAAVPAVMIIPSEMSIEK